DTQKLARMMEGEARWGSDQYSVTDLFGDMRGSIFSELASASSVDSYRRNLQRGYVTAVGNLMDVNFSATGFLADYGYQSVNSMQSDLRMLAMGELETMQSQLDRAASRTRDSMTRLHLRDLSSRIEEMLDADDD
ncbi:MAG: zinc-dependent metalloprotease, partial [Bacteroidetes Order II. Incertae sedis bacterium]|nr:zinc-dependent metalloprotease [Bacteroidetes Order II. bacterium]